MTFYKVDGYEGVAWKSAPEGSLSGRHDVEEFISLVMVGDDRVFLHDVDDVHLLDRDQFCGECGQIGCPHGPG